MIVALGVLLILAGVSVLLIGLMRLIFPSTHRFMPDDFKTIFSWRYGVYMMLAGIIFVFLLGQ